MQTNPNASAVLKQTKSNPFFNLTSNGGNIQHEPIENPFTQSHGIKPSNHFAQGPHQSASFSMGASGSLTQRTALNVANSNKHPHLPSYNPYPVNQRSFGKENLQQMHI